ncbi:MAG: sugar phosphate isomerase/epimerase [Chloroflexi bacterium]|nr:sugar phosphate isomerase/epimerase [Chloroflexota bacterium]
MPVPYTSRVNDPSPFGLSTSWNGTRHHRPADVVAEHRQLGFRRLEAYAHFTPDQLRELGQAAREAGVEITSLHSPCPIPVDDQGGRARWGDWLASTVEAERTYAVEWVKRTIDAAAELGARGIVIHLGNTGVFSRQGAVFESVARHGRGSEQHRALVAQAWTERENRKGPHLEAGLRSIRALGEHARGTSVSLGVEARDGYHEIPSLDEVADVLTACEGLPVYYWHDAGHGAKLEYGGFVEHEEYLRRYGDRMLGMHIHDTRDHHDHQAPGQADTDFQMLARYLRPETIKTLELNARVTPDQITRAVELLHEVGADAA